MLHERLDEWIRTHPGVFDGLLAFACLCVLGVFSITWNEVSLTTLGFVCLAVTAPIAWRRTHPTASVVAFHLAGFAQWVLTGALMPVDLAMLVGAYSAAAYAPRWVSRIALVSGTLGGIVTGLALMTGPAGISGVLTAFLLAASLPGMFATAWAAGGMRRTRRAYLLQLEERARRLEVEHAQQAALGAAAERARIAREMHDVVAHSLSVIIAQADGGRYMAGTSPESAVQALETVAATGRSALRDMRRLLGVLRQGEGRVLDPQPGLSGLPDLVASVRVGGPTVELVEEGTPRPVGDGMGLAGFRIVQEALTNVLKHAGPGVHVSVRVVWGVADLLLEVADDGRGASTISGDGRGASTISGGGHGLVGMRERATLYGGRVEAGPRPGGGWIVRAALPYPEVSC